MWLVTEDDKPCTTEFHNVPDFWSKAIFETRDDAIDYMTLWLGSWAPDADYWTNNSVLIFQWSDSPSEITKFEIKEV